MRSCGSPGRRASSAARWSADSRSWRPPGHGRNPGSSSRRSCVSALRSTSFHRSSGRATVDVPSTVGGVGHGRDVSRFTDSSRQECAPAVLAGPSSRLADAGHVAASRVSIQSMTRVRSRLLHHRRRCVRREPRAGHAHAGCRADATVSPGAASGVSHLPALPRVWRNAGPRRVRSRCGPHPLLRLPAHLRHMRRHRPLGGVGRPVLPRVRRERPCAAFGMRVVVRRCPRRPRRTGAGVRCAVTEASPRVTHVTRCYIN